MRSEREVHGEPSAGAVRSLEERLEDCLPQLARHLRGQGSTRGVEPEDLAQEVAARALAYRETFDPGRALWPWLKRLAQNVRTDQLRRVARDPARERAEASDEKGTRATSAQAAALEARETLEHALGQLSAIEREVLLRFHERGESIVHMAQELGCPEGTIKSHLHRARRRLAAGEDHDDE